MIYLIAVVTEYRSDIEKCFAVRISIHVRCAATHSRIYMFCYKQPGSKYIQDRTIVCVDCLVLALYFFYISLTFSDVIIMPASLCSGSWGNILSPSSQMK